MVDGEIPEVTQSEKVLTPSRMLLHVVAGEKDTRRVDGHTHAFRFSSRILISALTVSMSLLRSSLRSLTAASMLCPRALYLAESSVKPEDKSMVIRVAAFCRIGCDVNDQTTGLTARHTSPNTLRSPTIPSGSSLSSLTSGVLATYAAEQSTE